MKKKDLLAKYGIEFKELDIINPVTKEIRISKIFNPLNSGSYILASFFDDFQKPEDVKKGIIDIIDEVECRNIEEGETGSQSGIAVYINLDITKLVDFHSPGTYLEPDLILDTTDFKNLALAWKHFLEN